MINEIRIRDLVLPEFQREYVWSREQAKQLLALSSDEIESIFEDVHVHIEKAGQYFGLKIKNPKSVNEILQEANVRLNLINLDYDQMNKQLIRAKIELENLAKELEEKNRILDNLANIDGLTEVYNHRYFQNYFLTILNAPIPDSVLILKK